MNAPDLRGRHWATGQPVRIIPREGSAPAVEPAAAAPENIWVAPALFDLQVNGYAGVDFQQDNVELDPLVQAARALRKDGCSRWLLTLITDDWPRLTARLRRLCALRAASDELRRAIAGWHIEGPFLSAEPGFHGAHDPALMLDPAPGHIQELRGISGDDPLLLTLAPERPGALDAIALAVSMGIKVSLGHTNAPADVLRMAVQAGATGFTHFGNACPINLERSDNILWRVMDATGLTVSLIPDTHHVSPALFRLAHRIFGSTGVYYVSDATAAAGVPPGRYTVGRLAVKVGPDEIIRKPGSLQFAGSALRPVVGVFRAAQMLNCPWQEAWRRFSETPARFMGLSPGNDWCRIEFEEPGGAPISAGVL